MGKHEQMARLRAESERIAEQACGPGMNIVWGEGSLDSPLAIFGEAPGDEENRLMRPFVGRAGKFLETELVSAGIPRSEAYISNVVKCRPTTIRSRRPTNRAPTANEVNAWSDVLAREVEIVSPKIILCLGAVAASALIHPSFAMNAERGVWFDSRFGARATATFHPSYVLRTSSQGNDAVLQHFRRDLQAVAKAIGKRAGVAG